MITIKVLSVSILSRRSGELFSSTSDASWPASRVEIPSVVPRHAGGTSRDARATLSPPQAYPRPVKRTVESCCLQSSAITVLRRRPLALLCCQRISINKIAEALILRPRQPSKSEALIKPHVSLTCIGVASLSTTLPTCRPQPPLQPV